MKAAEINALGRVVSEIDYQFGPSVPLVVGGDFNFNLLNPEDLRTVTGAVGYTQPFDWLGVPPSERARATQSFQRKKTGQMQHSQIDSFFMHPRHRRLVKSVTVMPFLDAYGRPLPLPESGCEVNCLPSDHRPIVMEIQNPLFRQ